MAHVDVNDLVIPAPPTEFGGGDDERRAAIEAAFNGEPLNRPQLQAIFKLKVTQFHALLKAGAFERFLLQPRISNYCYSGVLIARYLSGDPLYTPTFGRKRK